MCTWVFEGKCFQNVLLGGSIDGCCILSFQTPDVKVQKKKLNIKI